VDTNAEVFENVQLNSTLLPGESVVLTFTSGYDFSAIGSYQLKVNLDYVPDLISKGIRSEN